MTQPTQPQTQYDDEIDLFELWQTIWSQKWLIIGLTLLVTVLAALYALSLPKVYQSNVSLLPPIQQNIEEINFVLEPAAQDFKGTTSSLKSLNFSYSPQNVFDLYRTELLSNRTMEEFYDQYQIKSYFLLADLENPHSQLRAYQKFVDSLSYSGPAKNASFNASSLTLEFTDAEKTAEWLNEYVKFTANKTRQHILDTIHSRLAQEKNQLQQQISALIEQEKDERQNKIQRLNESLEIAQKAGIHDSITNKSTGQFDADYLRGTKILAAEIQALKNRESDEAFALGVSKLSEKLKLINSVNLNADNIIPVQIDKTATVPNSPIKPNKKLIVAVALVLGGMLGVFIALIRGAVRKRKDLSLESAA
ncbi:MAG: LPS O-antigen chain length determinant protein WzzB [Thiomicrospira sp.]|uniref:LPS O-antigen chain length determinant protein WzzB n=1 Tax=Thiomicrospira sp. TaxID=935 RepID=UPI0019DB7BD0|nr:Wzz/FepE/Etk N-terminal domain-containing protein [Thiomicrospira sp.]MBE0493898.1 LPS O-antigen chain length determinant protein WzzB [Thiomicrospira sp.]